MNASLPAATPAKKQGRLWLSILKWAILDVLKGSVAALAFMVGISLGSLAGRWVGLPSVAMPAYLRMELLLPWMVVSAMLIAIVLGECMRRLYGAFLARLLAAWLHWKSRGRI